VATVPVNDPLNGLMKAETTAKRRATLSILGLGMLDETEIETIPAHVSRAHVDVPQLGEGAANDVAPAPAEVPVVPQELPPALQAFQVDLEQIELPAEAVSVWIKHRAELAELTAEQKEAAWRALCARTEVVGKMKNAKVWLKRAIAEEDARRNAATTDAPKES
jgi:hypothetical protein